jgi:hypothetical protein
MHCFNISVLQLLQCCYNFAQHFSIIIRSSSGAYCFRLLQMCLIHNTQYIKRPHTHNIQLQHF